MKKLLGLLVLVVSYIAAVILGIICFNLFKDKIDLFLNLLCCNVISTAFIWLIGVIFKTASIYDPYWSLQTPIIYIGLLIYFNCFNFGNILYLLFILFWAIRLTINFVIGFNDITYIDWRYKKIKEKCKMFYQIVSLIGIHLIPTLIVHFASIPAYFYIVNGCDFNALNLIGLVIMFLGVLLELLSDKSMYEFKKIRSSNKEIINIGLWKYSRHPNYLGEIIFWYGVALVYILANASYYYLILGALLNTLLFMFISIPLAEGNLKAYKDGYIEYKKRTRMLLPFKK